MNLLKVAVLRYLPKPLLLRLKKVHHLRQLREIHLEEEPDLTIVKELVSEGQTALDVGANVGLYTRFLSAQVGSRGRVVSLEPMPETFEILDYVVRGLKLRNVVPLNQAASDKPGRATMVMPIGSQGVENPYEAHLTALPTTSPDARSVSVTTLDEVVRRMSLEVHFAKIDVEGHELACIQGAMNTIGAFKPSLLIEISSDPDLADSPAARLCSTLKSMDYEIFWFDGKALRARKSGDRSTNYFFLQSAESNRLRSLGLFQ